MIEITTSSSIRVNPADFDGRSLVANARIRSIRRVRRKMGEKSYNPHRFVLEIHPNFRTVLFEFHETHDGVSVFEHLAVMPFGGNGERVAFGMPQDK